jgi:hypothetical protein
MLRDWMRMRPVPRNSHTRPSPEARKPIIPPPADLISKSRLESKPTRCPLSTMYVPLQNTSSMPP